MQMIKSRQASYVSCQSATKADQKRNEFLLLSK